MSTTRRESRAAARVEEKSSPARFATKKYAYVDALRGVAVLAVILVHTGLMVPQGLFFARVAKYGQYGVQLFFVLSAFTLCHSVDRLERLSRPEYLAFFIRRYFRIAPLYYLAIPIYRLVAGESLAVWRTTFFTKPEAYSLPAVASNLLFLHGLYPPGNNSIVPGGWSIGCEFLFYAIFPFLFFAARKRRWMLALATVLSLALTTGILVCKWHFSKGAEVGSATDSFIYFFISNQMPCFVLGMLYFFYAKQRSFRWLLLLLFVPGVMTLPLLGDWRWGWGLTPLIAGGISVGLALLFERCSSPLALQRIGQWSYSMYLWHFLPVWVLGNLLAGFLKTGATEARSLLFYLLCILLTVGLAQVSNRFIELPCIAFGRSLAARYK